MVVGLSAVFGQCIGFIEETVLGRRGFGTAAKLAPARHFHFLDIDAEALEDFGLDAGLELGLDTGFEPGIDTGLDLSLDDFLLDFFAQLRTRLFAEFYLQLFHDLIAQLLPQFLAQQVAGTSIELSSHALLHVLHKLPHGFGRAMRAVVSRRNSR